MGECSIPAICEDSTGPALVSVKGIGNTGMINEKQLTRSAAILLSHYLYFVYYDVYC